MNNKFRVWCENNKEWEDDPVVLLQNGQLTDLKHSLRIMRPSAHVVEFATGLSDKNGTEIYKGDRVWLFGNQLGEIVFECGAFGIALFDIDYEVIQSIMNSDENCCGNVYQGCFNDNFISLWELHWNFNCEEDVIHVLEVMENVHENPKPSEATP